MLLLLFGAFYWFQLRPSIIREQCFTLAHEIADKSTKEKSKNPFFVPLVLEEYFVNMYEKAYVMCLQSNGLEASFEKITQNE